RLFCLHGPAAATFYPLSLHDALPISGSGQTAPCTRSRSWVVARRPEADRRPQTGVPCPPFPREQATTLAGGGFLACAAPARPNPDRKSTRLNSSHVKISYAVFCLKKK